MKVVECIQIVCKLQVSVLHPVFDSLRCFLLHGIDVLEQVVAHLTCAEERVAFWTQTNKLLHRHRIQFILEEFECLAIHSAIEGMVEGKLTEINELQHPLPYLYRYLLSEQHKPNYPCP